MVIVLIADCFHPGIEISHLIEYQYITPVGYFLEDLPVKRLVGKEVNIVGKKKKMAVFGILLWLPFDESKSFFAECHRTLAVDVTVNLQSSVQVLHADGVNHAAHAVELYAVAIAVNHFLGNVCTLHLLQCILTGFLFHFDMLGISEIQVIEEPAFSGCLFTS